MFQIRLPINILKIIYGIAVVTENSSWATKHAARATEKVSQVAETVSYYAKEASKGIKNFNETIEQKAREVKEDYQQAIYKEEFKEINQEIIQGSEKFNPQLVEKTDAELDDWVILEKE